MLFVYHIFFFSILERLACFNYKICFHFIDCQPTEIEKEVWVKIQAVLKEAHNVLESLRQYTGAANVIRDVSL